MNKMFTIGPLNMEFLSRNPDIVHIHDAFRADDLNKLIVGAGKGLEHWAIIYRSIAMSYGF